MTSFIIIINNDAKPHREACISKLIRGNPGSAVWGNRSSKGSPGAKRQMSGTIVDTSLDGDG